MIKHDTTQHGWYYLVMEMTMTDRMLYVRRSRLFLRLGEITYQLPIVVGWLLTMCGSPPASFLWLCAICLMVSLALLGVSMTIMLWGMRSEKKHDLATDYADKT